jgi:hypothetical protein
MEDDSKINDINHFDNQIKKYRNVFTFLYESQYVEIEDNLNEIH